jgi:hypothetical protein
LLIMERSAFREEKTVAGSHQMQPVDAKRYARRYARGVRGTVGAHRAQKGRISLSTAATPGTEVARSATLPSDRP